MLEDNFSKWELWSNRSLLASLNCPGVYAISRTERSLAGEPFAWHPEIIYVGMTNSLGGLKSRLKQFDDSMQGKPGHGGAHRVWSKHRDYKPFCAHAYVSVAPFTCDPRAATPANLRIMGEVARFEFLCFAEFVELFGALPEFNDKKRSPKSKRIK